MAACQDPQGLPARQLAQPVIAGVFGHLRARLYGHVVAEGFPDMQHTEA